MTLSVISEKVKTMLNASTPMVGVTASTRKWQPTFDLKTLSTRIVYVVPVSVEGYTAEDREAMKIEYYVDILAVEKIATLVDATIDTFETFIEDVAAVFKFGTMINAAYVSETAFSTLVSSEEMNEFSQLSGRVRLKITEIK